MLLARRHNAGFTVSERTVASCFHIKTRGGKVGVAEADLDLPAIRAAFERVMRVGVTDPVRTRIEIATGIEKILRR